MIMMAPPLSAGLMMIFVFFFNSKMLNLGPFDDFDLESVSFNTLVLYLIMFESISVSSCFHPFEGVKILYGLTSSSESSPMVSISDSFIV